MTNSVKAQKNKSSIRGIGMLVASSLMITGFLFFLDEGYYNFNWMKSAMNWMAFVIYLTPIFVCQLVLYKFVFYKWENSARAIVSIVLGAIIGFLIALGFILL